MNKQKLVSIVLPVYNGANFLEESVSSCLKQSYQNIELIIVDDASEDESLDIAFSFKKNDSRVSIIKNNKNLKLPASLNVGFEKAKGDFLTWTSHDNMYKENAIEVMVDRIQKDMSDMVYAGYDLFDKDGLAYHSRVSLPEPYFIFFLNPFGACFLFTNEIFESLNGYDASLFLVEDYEFWLRAFLGKKNISKIDKSLYFYRIHDNSLTSSRLDEIINAIFLVHYRYFGKRGLTLETLRRVFKNPKDVKKIEIEKYVDFLCSRYGLSFQDINSIMLYIGLDIRFGEKNLVP